MCHHAKEAILGDSLVAKAVHRAAITWNDKQTHYRATLQFSRMLA